MENSSPNGWYEYKQRVLFELEDLRRRSENIEKKLDDLRTDVTVLKTKAILYGSVAGFVITVIVQFVINLVPVK